MPDLPDLDIERGAKGQPLTSTPGHGGARAGAGRPKGSASGPRATRDTASVTLAKAKAKREMYRAHLAELEFKEKSGELIPADEVAAAWVDRVQVAKGRLMALPTRIGPKLINQGDLRRIEQTLRDAVIEILEELAAEAESHAA